ncbi:hypothetical protein E3N88_37867 [Mikania micrantha]|uniref:FAR1 domain-containing protein n=1 Tax=Mikania micrantha TaxID=192012 RepID=A0A5N6LSL1_9ASTR|nr:hypothetical protein E3N88_37867 [Mikania micrantha]
MEMNRILGPLKPSTMRVLSTNQKARKWLAPIRKRGSKRGAGAVGGGWAGTAEGGGGVPAGSRRRGEAAEVSGEPIAHVHSINDDHIIFVDEEHGYVPDFPLLCEDCYEIPSNDDIDAPFVPSRGPEVITPGDVQQSRKANVEDFEGCYMFHTPNGTNVWCPNKGCDLKPTVGATYESWSEVLRMYKNYAECSGFSFRVGQTKKNKSNEVTHKYLRCNKDGRPQSKRKFDTLDESFMSVRNMSFQVTDFRDLSSNKSSDPVDSISKISNVEDIQNLVGGSLDVDLQCSNPQGIRNKGCGKSRCLIGAGEKAVEKSLRTPRLCRTCQKYVTGHDSRNCKKKRTEAVDVTEK